MTAASPTYFVLCDHDRDGLYYPERAFDRMTLACTVDDIASGELTNVYEVLAVQLGESTRDVTEQVARKVSEAWADYGDPLEEWQQKFICAHLGQAALCAHRWVA